MRFTAESGPDSATGWRGYGDAEIISERIGGDRRLVERGHFHAPKAARPIAFHNVYRWRRLADGLALWHERFGADAAVFLVDLIEAGDGRLITRAAHRCGADIYDATLTPTADGFTLDWTIRGPAKDERLCYHYTLAHPEEHRD